MPFFLNNYSPVLGFCPVPCRGGLAACIQLLLCEWQLIKALGFCWRHHHYVIPLQGSVLLAMKPTATRALKTQAQTLTKLPSSSSNISSDILLTETIVTILTVCYFLCCISSPLYTTINTEAQQREIRLVAASNTATLIMRVRIKIS